MEKLKEKNIIIKIALILAVIILFNFCYPTISQADDDDTSVIGGTLLHVFSDLLLAIGDGAINLIQNTLFGIDDSLVKVAVEEQSFWENVGMIAGAVVGVLAVTAIVIGTGGTALSAIIPSLIAGGAAAYAGHEIAEAALPQTFYLPVYAISPEEIFSNKIGLLDVNFFNPNDYDPIEIPNAEEGSEAAIAREQVSTASELQPTIASWYLAIRNFAIVVLLTMLLYIGIRIITSSAAQDKAKYKEKLFSWLVAMCLLFFMHYIMAFANTVVEALAEAINTINKPVIVEMPDLQEKNYEVEIVTVDETTGEREMGVVDAYDYFNEAGLIVEPEDEEGESTEPDKYIWPTNLMGTIRIDLQMLGDGTNDNQQLLQIGYIILFLILIFYTIAFLVVYIKRLIMLAFLTMMAPLVAMTYPLDKMNDGNAQAFNMWLKEYMFNLLIQPLHLILYTMLVGSAIDFAHENIIYAIVAIGFIFQAEKILRRFFGFDKASTIGNGSTIGGALAMAGIGTLKHLTGMGRGKKNKGGSQNQDGGKNPPIRTNKTNELLDEVQQDRAPAASIQQDRTPAASIQQDRAPAASIQQDRTPAASIQQDRAPAASIQQAQSRENPAEVDSIAETRQNDAIDNVYNPNKSAEWNRLNQERQAVNNLRNDAVDSADNAYLSSEMNKIRESDNRGMGEWIRDAYQGSSIQRGVNSIGHGIANSKRMRFVRKAGHVAATPIRATKRVAKVLPKPMRNTIRGVASVAGKGIKYVAPRAAKLYAKGLLAATAGTIGVAAGLASDDDRNILKYGAAGLGAGWVAGSGAINLLERGSSGLENAASTIQSTYTETAKGSEAEKARQRNIEEKAAMRDKDRQKLYAEKLGLTNNKEVKAALEDARQYREKGIMDDKLIIKAMQADGFGEGRANKERMILAGLATETGTDEKKIKSVQDRLKERGLEDKDVNKYIKGIRDITGAI